MSNNIYKANSLTIDLQMKHAGEEDIKLQFDNLDIAFHISYDGDEFISTMLNALKRFEFHGWDKFVLYDHLRGEKVVFTFINRAPMIEIDIETHQHEFEEFGANTKRWKISMPYATYRQSVIDTALYVLRRYGINGFSDNWAVIGGTYFVGALISILTNNKCMGYNDQTEEYHSDIKAELQTLIDAL